MHTVGPLTTRIAEVAVPALAAFATTDLAGAAEEIVRGLGEPLRVAVAGRVNAGKSTLVNSLLGQRAAPTDVSECTRVVTWYRHGDTEGIRVVRRDGTVDRLALRPDGSLPADLAGIDPLDVDHLEVDLSIDALRSAIIIDTPGLASTNDHLSAATVELLALDRDSRDAIIQADVLLLVVALGAHEDDVRVAEGFEAHFRRVDRSVVNTVGVLTKIDHLSVRAADDEVATAAAIAHEVAERMPLSVSSMVAVNALIAETTECGVLNESDAATLRAIAALDERERRMLVISTSRFVEADVAVPAEARARLLELLDIRGIEHALDLVSTGVSSANALAGALRASCGIGELYAVLNREIVPNTDAIKSAWALNVLDVLAYGVTDDGGAAQRGLRAVLDDLSLDPVLHPLRVRHAIRQCADGDVDLPDHLVDELRHLAVNPELSSALDGATDEEMAATSLAGARRWRAFMNEGRSSPSARSVAETVIQAYEMMWVVITERVRRSSQVDDQSA